MWFEIKETVECSQTTEALWSVGLTVTNNKNWVVSAGFSLVNIE